MARAAPQSASGDDVVICGGGVIGAATAYYLAQLGVKSVVVERHEIAGAASGKAGGFLAKDWNDGSPVGPLARKSFKLHEQLAEVFGPDTVGFRRLDTMAVTCVEGRRRSSGSGREPPGVPRWVDGTVVRTRSLGTTSTTAQVQPKLLTDSLLQAAVERGARVVHGCVDGVALEGERDATRRVAGVMVGSELLAASRVVIAMGPWTCKAAEWLPLPAISGLKYHSVVLETPPTEPPVTPTALFTTVVAAPQGLGPNKEPEIYPRPGRHVYVCGHPETLEVPGDPAQVSVREETCQAIVKEASAVASILDRSALRQKQACFLPLSPDGLPVIGAVPGVEGAYIATGHSCWGILNAPATGLALAELLVHGESSSVDLAAFNPARFF